MARKKCRVCQTNWPADTEFYRKPGSLKCIACEMEFRSPRKPMTEAQHQRKLAYEKRRREKIAAASHSK